MCACTQGSIASAADDLTCSSLGMGSRTALALMLCTRGRPYGISHLRDAARARAFSSRVPREREFLLSASLSLSRAALRYYVLSSFWCLSRRRLPHIFFSFSRPAPGLLFRICVARSLARSRQHESFSDVVGRLGEAAAVDDGIAPRV